MSLAAPPPPAVRIAISATSSGTSTVPRTPSGPSCTISTSAPVRIATQVPSVTASSAGSAVGDVRRGQVGHKRGHHSGHGLGLDPREPRRAGVEGERRDRCRFPTDDRDERRHADRCPGLTHLTFTQAGREPVALHISGERSGFPPEPSQHRGDLPRVHVDEAGDETTDVGLETGDERRIGPRRQQHPPLLVRAGGQQRVGLAENRWHLAPRPGVLDRARHAIGDAPKVGNTTNPVVDWVAQRLAGLRFGPHLAVAVDDS